MEQAGSKRPRQRGGSYFPSSSLSNFPDSLLTPDCCPMVSLLIQTSRTWRQSPELLCYEQGSQEAPHCSVRHPCSLRRPRFKAVQSEHCTRRIFTKMQLHIGKPPQSSEFSNNNKWYTYLHTDQRQDPQLLPVSFYTTSTITIS